MDSSSEQDPKIPKAVSGKHGTVSLHILLAEDNTFNRFFAKTILEKQGHTIVEVENGREVLEKLTEESFDVILMDIQMPELDGLETTRLIRACAGQTEFFDHPLRDLLERIRQQIHGSRVSIVAMTAHAMAEDRRKSLEAGMDSYVIKPFGPQELLAAISQVTRPRSLSVDRM